MRLQVLMSVMNQGHDIVKKANIHSDAIVINQCREFKKEIFKYNGHDIQFLSFDEKGVGRSRNSALMRADADIVLFSDQSVVYEDDYADAVKRAFADNPRADMIVFNVPCEDPKRKTYKITKRCRIRKYNCLRYGAVRMAVRLDSIKRVGLSFSLLFGGGAKYQSGEDSLFIYQSLGCGLKVVAVPVTIGMVKTHDSSWFSGYTDKFFMDKGALFKAISPRLYLLYIVQFSIRKVRTMGGDTSIFSIISSMLKGAKTL